MVCHTLRQIMEGGIIMFNTCRLESGLNNNNNHDGDDKKELFKQIHFLLCESCFWCASYLSSKSVSVAKCPNCYNNKIEWMPISKVDLDKLTKEGASAPYYTTQVS
jgi:hypothetical protein